MNSPKLIDYFEDDFFEDVDLLPFYRDKNDCEERRNLEKDLYPLRSHSESARDMLKKITKDLSGTLTTQLMSMGHFAMKVTVMASYFVKDSVIFYNRSTILLKRLARRSIAFGELRSPQKVRVPF